MAEFVTLLKGGFGNPNAYPQFQHILDQGGNASELLARAIPLTFRRFKEEDAVITSDGEKWARVYYFPLWSGKVAVLLPPDTNRERSSIHDTEQCLVVLHTADAPAEEVREFIKDLDRAIQAAASVAA